MTFFPVNPPPRDDVNDDKDVDTCRMVVVFLFGFEKLTYIQPDKRAVGFSPLELKKLYCERSGARKEKAQRRRV